MTNPPVVFEIIVHHLRTMQESSNRRLFGDDITKGDPIWDGDAPYLYMKTDKEDECAQNLRCLDGMARLSTANKALYLRVAPTKAQRIDEVRWHMKLSDATFYQMYTKCNVRLRAFIKSRRVCRDIHLTDRHENALRLRILYRMDSLRTFSKVWEEELMIAQLSDRDRTIRTSVSHVRVEVRCRDGVNVHYDTLDVVCPLGTTETLTTTPLPSTKREWQSLYGDAQARARKFGCFSCIALYDMLECVMQDFSMSMPVTVK